MPKSRNQENGSPPSLAVGCHDCGAETAFTGETSNVKGWVWYWRSSAGFASVTVGVELVRVAAAPL
jgi:hypothetical protein